MHGGRLSGTGFVLADHSGVISGYGWPIALIVTAISVCLILPLAFTLPSDPRVRNENVVHSGSSRSDPRGICKPGILLTAGFFVCGFHVAFITVHLPIYVADLDLAPMVGAVAISLIGIFNILGSLLSGVFGQSYSKEDRPERDLYPTGTGPCDISSLTEDHRGDLRFCGHDGDIVAIYRALDSGARCPGFGIRYMATLYGFVFLSHQIGSFIGVWLGGFIHDTTRSYDLMWQAGILMGLVAAVIHLPIDENPVPRLQEE